MPRITPTARSASASIPTIRATVDTPTAAAAFPLSVGPPAGTVDLSNGSDSFIELSELQQRGVLPAEYAHDLRASSSSSVFSASFDRGFLLDTSYVYTRGKNLNFATDINQATTPGSTVGWRIWVHQSDSITAATPTPYSTASRLKSTMDIRTTTHCNCALQKRMSYGLSFQLNYAWSKSLDTGTGNGHGSGIDIYQNAYTSVSQLWFVGLQRGQYVGRPDHLRVAVRPRAPICTSRAARPDCGWMAHLQPIPVARRCSVHPGDPECGCGWN